MRKQNLADLGLIVGMAGLVIAIAQMLQEISDTTTLLQIIAIGQVIMFLAVLLLVWTLNNMLNYE